MNSFYITLTNNDLYSQNTLSEFRTILDSPITLDGEFEVALVEISYKTHIEHDIGNLIVTDTNINFEKKYPIVLKDRSTIHDFKRYLYVNCEVDTLINIENKIITILPKDKKNQNIHMHDVFKYNNQTVKENVIKINIPNKFVITSDAYIYCDIIDDQYFNNKKEKLLKSIKIRGSILDDIKETFNHPQYLSVNKTYISDILISIKDSNNIPIKFVSGPIIIKLHFRKNEFLRNTPKRRFNGCLSK